MRFNTPDDDENEDEFDDPIDMVPKKVRIILDGKIHELSGNLSKRQTHFMNMEGIEVNDQDASSLALVERLAFYELSIDALVRKVDNLEKKVDGMINGSDKN